MFLRPQFLGVAVIPAASLIHEDALQAIQGGITGQHYHLTAAQHSYLLSVIANPVYSEPVMTSAGEIITASDGDIVMVIRNIPA